jgi:hypothetical protein
MFQVHVRLLCGPGSRIFTLRQDLKQDGVSCNLTLDHSHRTLMTEGYTKKMGLRKLDGRAAVGGLRGVEFPPKPVSGKAGA